MNFLAHSSRLWKLWCVFAYYRLDTLLPGTPPLKARLIIFLFRIHPLWWVSGARANNPNRLRLAFEELGPLFIKLGQLLATRRDLFPDYILDELSKLQDQVAPFSSEQAQEIIEQAQAQPLSKIFQRFDTKPLAAASIAQVHTAQLFSGEEVVVKILRPGVAEAIRQDMALIKDITAFLENRFPYLQAFHLQRIARDYEQTLLDETDLLRESANTQKMRQNFLNSDLLYVPKVYPEFCYSNIMVAERIYGLPIDQIQQFDALGINRQALSEKGLTIFFTQLLEHNFFHADMHPGNVFVETQNPEKPRYIALDVAIVGQLSHADRMTIARLILALIQRDFIEIIRTAHRAGWLPPAANIEQLAGEVERIAGRALDKPIDQVEFGPIMVALLDMARTHHLEIPTQLVLLIKTLIHVEGLGRSLYPALDIWSLAKPLITRWLNDQIGPAALTKRIGQQLPTIITSLPDLPDLFLDALTQLRNSGQWQEKNSRELQTLRQQMQQQKRADVLGVIGVLAGFSLLNYPQWHTVGIMVIGCTLVWRLSR